MLRSISVILHSKLRSYVYDLIIFLILCWKRCIELSRFIYSEDMFCVEILVYSFLDSKKKLRSLLMEGSKRFPLLLSEAV